MNRKQVRQILKDTDYVHVSGSPEERKTAEYLRDVCEKLGAKARLEAFPVEMAEIRSASLTVTLPDGREKAIPCKGYKLCGSGEAEAPFVYLPDTDPASLKKAKGCIVMIDTGLGIFTYKDLKEAGAVGIVTYDGNVNFRDSDIDQKELRPYVSKGDKRLAVSVNAKEAFGIVKSGAVRARIRVEQEEFSGESHNVIAEIPGSTEEWIVLTAHYDTTPLSHGSYDNMTGCIGLLAVMDALKGEKHRYGLRFVFCGSEERGLRGSKAYVSAHEAELDKVALNINLDMIGTYMGRFIARVSAEEALVQYLRYFGSIRGFGIKASQGVYSSDSTPFADKGVPALSFARLAGGNMAPIHNRYDTPAVLSDEQILTDSAFIAAFAKEMADAVLCPVRREIPEKVKNDLDEYLGRKRKED